MDNIFDHNDENTRNNVIVVFENHSRVFIYIFYFLSDFGKFRVLIRHRYFDQLPVNDFFSQIIEVTLQENKIVCTLQIHAY